MRKRKIILGDERFVTDANGDVEFVLLPVKKYESILNLLEDYGLGNAIKLAEDGNFFTREEALSRLEND